MNNKKIKIIIPFIVVLALIIIICIYFKEYKYSNYRNKADNLFYEFFGEEKIEYTATISYDKKNVIKGFEPKDYNINYESIPIYYKEEKKVIFPSNMAIIFPLKQKMEYKIPEFSYLDQTNGINYLVYDNYNNNVDHFIIYDGKNLYFFGDSVTFNVDNTNITLSPFSYVIYNQGELSYYDYDSDLYKVISVTNKVILSNKYYNINISDGNLEYQDGRLIFTNNIDLLGILK